MANMTEKTNASQFPKVFYCKHMQPGTAKYEDETILVDHRGMVNLLKTGVGKPVYINHQNVSLKDIKSQADGYITDSFYNELDGWGWFKFLAIDDKAHKAIDEGWAVSNAYAPTEFGPGGTKNNCKYDREVINGEFTHLAIVPDPRYEGAKIFSPDEFKNYQENLKSKLSELQNSNSKGSAIMKFFKFKKEEVSTIDADTMAELPDGTTVKVSEMVNALTAEKQNKKQMVNVAGEEMPLDELVNKYCKLNKKEKKNKSEDDSFAEAKDGDEDEVDETDDEVGDDKKNKKMKKNVKKNVKKNEKEEDEDEDAEKKEKKNSTKEVDNTYFDELRNAHLKAQQAEKAPLVVTSIDQIARGKKRYGSGK